MFYIVSKKILNDQMTSMRIKAPLIAKNARAGQFLIVRVSDKGERIPLTISDFNRESGTVTIVYQKVGKTTFLLDTFCAGDYLPDVVGPLGKPTELDGYKNVLLIAGGAASAIIYPQAKSLREVPGVNIDVITGFRNKDLIILENELRRVCDNLVITTDDGSGGRKGFVTDILKEMIDSGKKYDLVIAIGPVLMMKTVCELTKEFRIKTIVSMNPIMIDGSGMCGGCRVKVKDEIKFACIDGPDFDGHEVDFDDAANRLKTYKDIERKERDEYCNLFNMRVSEDALSIEKNDNIKLQNIGMPNSSLKRTPPREQEPLGRSKNFSEVSLGYTDDMAMTEALRCLNCKNPSCVKGCPVGVDIPKFISFIKNNDFKNAYLTIIKSNALPAVCGRVCPQERQCELKCVRGKNGDAVGIGYLERFVSDWWEENQKVTKEEYPRNGKKIAIVGSGPSGLTCASSLYKYGYEVTVFEALHTPGGVLSYGIPEFRLPKDIVKREISALENMGVKIETNVVVGKTITIDWLWSEGYSAIYISSGAGLPRFMGIPGEELIGVYSANEFLTRINLMKAYKEDFDTPILKMDSVAVVGGGNVAIDAARCAKRLGASHVYVIYRRSENEMPARLEEVKHAKEEGIEFKFLSNPKKIVDDGTGKICKIECINMTLSDKDASGRQRPIEIEGSKTSVDVDGVIMAIGNTPNPIVKEPSFGILVQKDGRIVVDENLKTSRNMIYAGGDAVSGAATVILAMQAGKTAANNIHSAISASK